MSRQRLAPGGLPTRLGLGFRLRLGRLGVRRDLLAQVFLEILQPHLELRDLAVQLLGGLPVALRRSAASCIFICSISSSAVVSLALNTAASASSDWLASRSVVSFGDGGAVLRHFQTQRGNLLLGRQRFRHVGNLFNSGNPYQPGLGPQSRNRNQTTTSGLAVHAVARQSITSSEGLQEYPLW